jgi:AcrR family transcriptional regulator
MAAPPYLRIVEEIRHRIASGELRPGDRVPSARRITQDRGVAIATATKVLATLKQDGLVRVVPGVGTVVAPSRPAAPATRPPTGPGASRARPPESSPPLEVGSGSGSGPRELHRDLIVEAAIEIADSEGLAALSMRRVAASLGAATMSLYRHVRSREELVLFMIDSALGANAFPSTPAPSWRAGLETAARMQWRVFAKHPWLAPMMSVTRPQLAPNALRHTEWVLGTLAPLGLHPSEMLRIHVLLFSYVRGIATNLEAEAEAQRETGMDNDEWMAGQRAAMASTFGPGRYTHLLLGVANGGDFEFDLPGLFEFGLSRLLDGLERHLAARTRRR